MKPIKRQHHSSSTSRSSMNIPDYDNSGDHRQLLASLEHKAQLYALLRLASLEAGDY